MCADDAKETNVPATLATVTAATPATPKRAQPPATTSERAGLETLFRAHHEQVYRAAYRVTGSPTDAEDVLQTIFLRLAGHTDVTDLAPNPGAYLHRAAINAALDVVRSRSRARAVGYDAVEPSQLTSREPSPAAAHDEQELRRLVQQAVSRLGERAAEVFVLRYFEGYDNREIAEMLATSQMVVAVTLHRARTRLRREIGEYLEKHDEA